MLRLHFKHVQLHSTGFPDHMELLLPTVWSTNSISSSLGKPRVIEIKKII